MSGGAGDESFPEPSGVTSLDEIAYAFAEICLKAAVPVMDVYATEFTPEQKADRSPVTEADRRAEAVILEALGVMLPATPVVAEESFEAGARAEVGARFCLVDPLDGTREFIARNDEFTVNIALVEDGVPIAGCVYAPALNRIYLGGEKARAGRVAPGSDLGAVALEPITVRPPPANGTIAVMSRSHADEKTRAFLERERVRETIAAGSSLKFCRVAEGAADLYPRFAPTMEWDTAAGHAVLAAAGGAVTNPDGSKFLYAKADGGFRNGPFIAWGGRG